MDLSRVRELTPEVESAIDDFFAHNKPDPGKLAAADRVRKILSDAAKTIVQNIPPSPDRTVAMRKLRETLTDSEWALAHGGQ
jgi:hypothetical protein